LLSGPDVPIEPLPFQVANAIVNQLRAIALGIEILDSKDNSPLLSSHAPPRDEKAPRMAQVKMPGRAWCKPSDDRHYRRFRVLRAAAARLRWAEGSTRPTT
jgi:hypothetical protein